MVGDIAMGCIVITLARIVGWKLFWLMEKFLRTGMGALPKAKTFADLWKTDECGVKRLSYK